MAQSKFVQAITFPAKILSPVRAFLTGEARKLEKRQKELKEIDPFSDPDRVIDNAAIDTDATEQTSHERVAALKEQVNRRLIQVRKALAQIRLGKYGICEKCHQMIDTDRLMVMPEATVCAECAKKSQK
jgi:RNA polymerase-binding transcription factor DksA